MEHDEAILRAMGAILTEAGSVAYAVEDEERLTNAERERILRATAAIVGNAHDVVSWLLGGAFDDVAQ